MIPDLSMTPGQKKEPLSLELTGVLGERCGSGIRERMCDHPLCFALARDQCAPLVAKLFVRTGCDAGAYLRERKAESFILRTECLFSSIRVLVAIFNWLRLFNQLENLTNDRGAGHLIEAPPP